MFNEVQIAENVRNFLRPYGDVLLPYITANFEPFSSQSRPDIVFVPRIAPTNCFCIELRFGPRRQLQPALLSSLTEHYQYLRSQVECRVFAFAFATDQNLEPEVAAMLMEQKVRPFSGVTGADDLAHRIMTWTQLPVG